MEWAKDGKLVDTNRFHKDGGPDLGIVECSADEIIEREMKKKEEQQKRRERFGEDLPQEEEDEDQLKVIREMEEEEETDRGDIREYGDKVSCSFCLMIPLIFTILW